MARDPARVARVRHDTFHGRVELGARLGIRVGLEDPRLRLHHLGERPEGHAVAVRQRATLPPQDDVGDRLDVGLELGDQTALADPRNPDDGDELRRGLCAGSVERVDELIDLTTPADEGRLGGDGLRAHSCPRVERLPDREGLGLPFGLYALELTELDHRARRAISGRPDDDAIHGRRGLQTRRRVDDVAGGHSLTRLRPCAEVDQCLSRVDGDPHLHLLLVARPVADRECRAHSALGVVLVGRRRAEQRHHGVADELLHRPAMPLELLAQLLVIRTEDRLDVLRIELLGLRRESDEVGEQDRDDLALAPGFHASAGARRRSPARPSRRAAAGSAPRRG